MAAPDTLQPMVVSDQKIREGFSGRLAAALRASSLAPDEQRRWRPWLSARYGVSQEAARKWLSALALPEMTKVVAIAIDLEQSAEYLLTGRKVGDAPAAATMSKGESDVLTHYRAAPPYGQAIVRNAASAAANSARTLHVVSQRTAAGVPNPAAAVDITVLQQILELMESIDVGNPAQRAGVIAAYYDYVADSGSKPTRAGVLRLLRSAM